MTTRSSLIAHLQGYQTTYADEHYFIRQFLALLQHPDSFQRTHLPGHVTGSAWVINEDRDRVLLTHHAKLNRWLQPGGHADGDENIISVASREALEETGLKSLRLFDENIFDIDVHLIPAHKEMSAHYHYDIRLLLEASSEEAFTVTEESHALAWIHLDEIETITEKNSSILRMRDKTRDLRSETKTKVSLDNF
ncbi:MAG TPA: NUDIX hydrolase [Chryseosolibacter sp.]|nr:NUDIX hydrolase [Chryseosolibacter sp.]